MQPVNLLVSNYEPFPESFTGRLYTVNTADVSNITNETAAFTET